MFRSVKFLQFPTRVFSNNIEELQIQVPWGYIAGKKYHRIDQDRQVSDKKIAKFNTNLPIIFCHGINDNLGSMEPLINKLQILQPTIECYSFDFPGHGQSSWKNDQLNFRPLDATLDILRVLESIKIKKFNACGHSVGAMVLQNINVLYPGRIDSLIRLCSDGMATGTPYTFGQSLKQGMDSVLTFGRKRDKFDEKYSTYQELHEKLCAGFNFYGHQMKSTVNSNVMHHILDRGITPHPNNNSNKKKLFKLSRDPILTKTAAFQDASSEFSFYAQKQAYKKSNSKRLKELHILAKNDMFYDLFLLIDEENYYVLKEFYEIFSLNENYQTRLVDGNHHVHLNESEKIAGMISSWIDDVGDRSDHVSVDELFLQRTDPEFLEDLE